MALKRLSLIISVLSICSLAAPSLGMACNEPIVKQDLEAVQADASLDASVLRLAEALQKALAVYRSLEDYSAVFYKRERSQVGLGEEELIYFKFQRPCKIFMHWLNTDKKGVQVLYEKGKHDGKLMIHQPGLLLGLMPVIALPQDSPWIREGSQTYNIEDAGIGTFLYDLISMVIKGSGEKKISVQLLAPDAAGRTMIEARFPGTTKDSTYFAERIVVGFDPSSGLTDYMELYDWEGQPIGVYEYRDIKLDQGQDPEFKKHIHKQLLRVYNRPLPDKVSQEKRGQNFAASKPSTV